MIDEQIEAALEKAYVEAEMEYSSMKGTDVLIAFGLIAFIFGASFCLTYLMVKSL